MSKEAMKLDDKAVAQILSHLPSPPVGDGSALHAWAMQVVRKLAEQPEQQESETITQTFTGIPKRKLRDLLSAGWQINGVCFQRTEEDGTVRRGAATTGGMVLWWNTEQPASLQHFDHTVAANAALRDAQNRSYQIAKCKYPKCSYPCKDLPDCRDADQPAQQEREYWEEQPDGSVIPVDPSEMQPAQQQEPVAGLIPFPKLPGGIVKHEKLGELFDGLQVQKYALGYAMLYTAPQPPAQPLTDERIEEIAARTLFPVNFARAIEAAHGIKGEA